MTEVGEYGAGHEFRKLMQVGSAHVRWDLQVTSVSVCEKDGFTVHGKRCFIVNINLSRQTPKVCLVSC